MATPRENLPGATQLAVADPAELAPGTLVDGRYRVLRVIGIGGTGIVYEVEAAFGGQRLALKTLLDPQHAPRLEQEARALAQLKSAHVVKVVDFGQCEVGPYMVMTLLVGQNLRDVLESKQKLSLGFVANLALQVCEGLDEAHQAGLIHRDLKPDNLHLADPAGASKSRPPSADTVVTVFDFGVVKMSAALGNNPLTRTGSTVGTPYYMSLEQLRGAGTVDAISDVYAFCVVLYECLAGQRPFEAGTLGDLIFAICSTTPPHLHTVRPDVPREVADIVMRGLSREKAERPASMRALAATFANHADKTLSAWLDNPPEAPSDAPPAPFASALNISPSKGTSPAPPKVVAAPAPAPPKPPAKPEVPTTQMAASPTKVAVPPRPSLPRPATEGAPRPPGARSTARALPNPALLAASAMDMPATPEAEKSRNDSSPPTLPEREVRTAPQAAQAPKPSNDAPPSSGEKPKAPPAKPSGAAFARPLSAGGLKPPPPPARPASDSKDDDTQEGDEAPPDRETPTEMFVPKKHGELEAEGLFNLETSNGQLPTMDLPTDFVMPGSTRRQLQSEDKTALLDIEALQKNPPNPAPTFTRTAPPPSPSNPGGYGPQSQSGVRQVSSPNLASFADPNSVSGSYQLPSAAFATQALATPGLANPSLAASASTSPSFAPSSSPDASPFVKKIDKALVSMGHAGNQFGLKVLLRFRSATQEQQIMFVVVGTATFAIFLVLLIYLLFV